MIPTWNNVNYLKNCVEGIRSHSFFKPEILVYVNEGKDGTLNFLEQEKISHIHSHSNQGICIAMNALAKIASTSILCYINDDMYPLPHWDQEIISFMRSSNTEVLCSATMVEPFDTGNPCVVVGNYGDSIHNFQKEALLNGSNNLKKGDWSGSSWPPLFIQKSLWNKIDGFDERYSPGMYSDPDLGMKAWQIGVRDFRGFGNALVYHFGSKSTSRLGKNIGRSLFLKKWGMTARFFYKRFLKMGQPYTGPLSEYQPSITEKLMNKVKQLFA